MTFIVTPAQSQTVNGIPFDKLESEYVLIFGSFRWMSRAPFNVRIDFGFVENPPRSYDIKDENGKAVEFSSIVGALNFFTKNGYELVHSSVDVAENTNLYSYLVRRKRLDNKAEN
ncbi:MAG: hypothetical protein EA362_11870 [Saprospirales bacterium]|nr:MAG: hypothetical protein EA362_11870 [Saprospirales bacterium]